MNTTQELMQKLDELAEELEDSRSAVALIAIKEYLERHLEEGEPGDVADLTLRETEKANPAEENHIKNLRRAIRLQSRDLLRKEEKRRRAKHRRAQQLEKEYLKQT